MEKNKELHCSYFSISHSFCLAMYNVPVDCSITINIAEPFMDVPHLFCHCKRELYDSTLFVMTITGRFHCEELQQRYHVSATFANFYIVQ
jgi:hypothetical protein